MVAQLDDGAWLASGTLIVKRIPYGMIAGLRCPFCRGNCHGDGEEISCMMCGRPLRVTTDSPRGDPQALGGGRAPIPIRKSTEVFDDRRAALNRGRDDGSTGLQARLLRAIPEAPGRIGAWALARPLRVPTERVRELLDELIELGLVQSIEYQAGCVEKRRPATGYQRPRLEAPS